jgi:hypothetical protein
MRKRRQTVAAILLVCHCILCSAPRASASAPAGTAERVRPLLAASSVLLASVAFVMEVESDRAYSRYQKTADPSRMSTYYDAAERDRDVSTAAFILADVCAVAFVFTYLSEKRPTEPEPGAVIVGLAVVPGGAAVQLRW